MMKPGRKPGKPEYKPVRSGTGRRKPVEIEDAIESVDSMRTPCKPRNKDYSPLTFYIPEELDKAYDESDWSVQRRIRILTAIADDYESDPRAALAAIDQMEKYQWAAVKASGQIQEVATTTKSERDGVLTEEDVKTMRMGGIVDAKVIETEETDEQGETEEGREGDDGPRDDGHKPPTDAYSGGLFSD